MNKEELEKEAKVFATYYESLFPNEFETFYKAFLKVAETREKCIATLYKENGKLEGKLADLQSEYIELENFKNNEVNELKAQIEKMKCLLNEIYSEYDFSELVKIRNGLPIEIQEVIKETEDV